MEIHLAGQIEWAGEILAGRDVNDAAAGRFAGGDRLRDRRDVKGIAVADGALVGNGEDALRNLRRRGRRVGRLRVCRLARDHSNQAEQSKPNL